MLEPAGPRILIVRVGAMGDVLHALPAVARLRERLPSAYIGWAIEPRWAVLLRGANAREGFAPLVDRVHSVEARAWSERPFSLATARSVLALRGELRQQRYAIAIDLQGSARSALIARLSGASIVGGNAPREWPARWFYSRRVAVAKAHVVEQAAEIVAAALDLIAPERAAGVGMPELGLLPRPSLLPQDDAAGRWGEAMFPTGAGALIVLAPTAGWGAKEWPAERYGELAAELVGRGYRIVVNATSPLPEAVAEQVVSVARTRLGVGESDRRVQVVASSLPQLTAMLRRASLVIAGDTGPLHLASALGRPVVALFGPTDPARTGPFGTVSRVLRDAGSVTDHRRHGQTEAGLARIGVDAVLASALDLLGEGEPRADAVEVRR